MKINVSLTMAASIVLLSSGTVQAELSEDQTLEPVTLSSAEISSTELASLDSKSEGVARPMPIKPFDTPAGPQLQVNTTKIGLPLNQIGSFATVVTRQQIQQMQANSILDVLRRVPGVDVVQNGGMGQTASIFIRGMNAEHTMVLVDGIEVNDPISPGRTVNFPDQFSIDSVDRIEVLRGPQSQLYGSDAIGGVINIITDVGAEKTSMYVKSQAGSYGTFQNDAEVRGKLGDEKLRYTFHGTHISTQGYSAASSRYGNPERDGYKGVMLTGRVAAQPLKNVSLNFLSNFANTKTGLDTSGGYFGDDPNYTMRNKTLLLGGRSRITLFNNRFEQITRYSVSNNWRKNNNDFNPGDPFSNSERSRYNGQMVKIDMQNNFHLSEKDTVMGGLEVTNERGDFNNNFQSSFGPYVANFSNRTATNVGFYLQNHYQLSERWFTTAGMRYDNYNRFGHATTYRVASTYLIPETGTTLRSSYGTGFKAPTLYQLYSSSGNDKLNAEKSKGFDFGLEQNLFKNKLVAGATYFHNNVDNMINYNNATFLYENLGKAKMQGSEVYATWAPWKWLVTKASYTALATRDVQNHNDLVRRPKNKMSFNINIQPTRRMNINLDVSHIGVREDFDFATYPATRTKLSAYTLINLALSYKLTEHCSIFGRLVNLLDTPYETVKGYGAPRISAYGGLQLGI